MPSRPWGRGQAVEIFVELTWGAAAGTQSLLRNGNRAVFFTSGACHGADTLGEARHLPRGGLAMNHTLLRRAGKDGLGFLQGRASGFQVARGDRLFHLAD